MGEEGREGGEEGREGGEWVRKGSRGEEREEEGRRGRNNNTSLHTQTQQALLSVSCLHSSTCTRNQASDNQNIRACCTVHTYTHVG